MAKKGSSGSVSIYFIAATAALVLVTAVLIDFARVAAFRKQSELAVKSGVRSVLSSFDPVLYSRYGLFVRGGEPADRIFTDTVNGNVPQADSAVFPYLDPQWEQTGVTESRPIADHVVFRRQVLEEMKYKAPIDLTIELAERLRGMSGMMEETAMTVDALERMQQAYDRREEALDRALEEQRIYGDAVRASLAEEIPNPPVQVSPVAATGNVSRVEEVANQYDDYVTKRLDDEARRQAILAREEERRKREEERKSQAKEGGGDSGDDQPTEEQPKEESAIEEADKPRYEAIVSGYETGASRLASALAVDAEAARSESEAAFNDAREAWLEAKEANEEMSRIASEAASIKRGAPKGEVVTADSASSAEQVQAMADLRRKAAEMVLVPQFFTQYEAEIDRQYEHGTALLGQAGAFSALAASVAGSTGKGESLRSGADRLQREYADFIGAYGSAGSILSERAAVFQAHRSQDEERKQEEEKANSEWAGAKQLLGMLTGRSGTPEERAVFDRLQQLYEDNLKWNEAEEEYADSKQANDPDQGRDEAVSLSGNLLSIVEDSLIGTRDQLYFSEYAISRMSRYDPAYVKELLRGEEAPLSIDSQQTEYILYGFHNPSGNIAAAYGEIFAFRLAVRTMEGFVECSKLGHPLLVLVAALVYGIRNAIADLNALVDKGTIQLSKYAKVATNYTDYLRLFMLLHGGSGNQMARMIAIMELETGVSFQEAYTYASGEGTASVKLWFFPGLVRMLGGSGDLGGTVRGGRYEATYSADYSYQ
ncbi:hypothetical protein [Cohnella yongneupensis]|uniref:Flp pilus-assembly TadE/G-like protein n=1 Tax=Cohnella yongneupensis TaxID=425006 RepID=A0ABW0R724_9BACL